MFKQRSYKFPRRFWHFLALGVPWVLGVGILVAAQHAQGGAWLMRGLIDLATGPSARHDASEARHHKVARQWEEKSYARGFRFEPGQHVATLDAVGNAGVVPSTAPLAHLDGLNAVEPQVWASIDRAEVALGDALRHDELADLQRSRAEIRLVVEQAACHREIVPGRRPGRAQPPGESSGLGPSRRRASCAESGRSMGRLSRGRTVAAGPRSISAASSQRATVRRASPGTRPRAAAISPPRPWRRPGPR